MILKRLVNPRLITMLNPNPNASQSQRASIFQEGLKQVCDLWYIKFNITASGLCRPKWIADKNDIGRVGTPLENYHKSIFTSLQFQLPDKAEKPMDRYDFRKAAENLDGSADLSAQLFCCLLRAVGVEARLVFSLQPLGLNASAEPPSNRTPSSGKTTLYAASTDDEADTSPNAAQSLPSPAARIAGATLTPQRIRRFGQARAGPSTPVDLGKPPPGLTASKSKKVQRPLHPIFWVEAFNPAYQKWIAVDAVSTKTVGRPSRLEPALSDQKNCLTYAIAFEEDGHAKDVTCRYAKAFNAKTRKMRVESTDGGMRWLKKALKLFTRYALMVC
jgi:xeroderma pigmentosum group C-complementing protein